MQRRVYISVDFLCQSTRRRRPIRQRRHDLIDPRSAVGDLVIDHPYRVFNRMPVAGIVDPVLTSPHHRQRGQKRRHVAVRRRHQRCRPAHDQIAGEHRAILHRK